jgi:hypothetical protein
MSHLQVGLLILSLLVIFISLESKVVIVDTELLRKNAPDIAKWIVRVLLESIIKSFFK